MTEGSNAVFFKTRSKKHVDIGIRASRTTRAHSQKFFASFFQKRSASFLSYGF
jgi:hypothetical protein